jgi:hypothetical protein
MPYQYTILEYHVCITKFLMYMLSIFTLILPGIHISRTTGSQILSLPAPFIQISIKKLYYSFEEKQNNFLMVLCSYRQTPETLLFDFKLSTTILSPH